MQRISGRLAALPVLAIACFMLVPDQALAAPAFVQEKDILVTSGSRASAAFGSPNAAGNLIVVFVEWDNSAPATITDSRGNVYASAVGPTKFDGDAANAQIFYAKNIAAGANTVTAAFSSTITQYAALYVHEYSGLDTVNPVDGVAANSGSSSSMTSGTIRTSTANVLLFSGAESAQTINSVGTGFVTRSSAYGNRTMDRTVTSAGTYSASARQTGNAWVMQLIAFRAAGAGGGIQLPTVPAALSAVAVSSTQINLSWSASTSSAGIAGYRVFRNGVQVATTSASAYTDAGLTPATAYSYAVSAFDSQGNSSALSATTGATTLAAPIADTTAPSIPAGLSAVGISPSQINLSWAASTDDKGVAGYVVYRNGAQVASLAGTSYSSTGLAPSTVYAFAVSAFDAAGNVSASSSIVTASTLAPPPDLAAPSIPTGLSAIAVSSTQVNLAWTPSTDNIGVAGYRILRNGSQIATTGATAFSNSGLAAATTYLYSVAAYDAAGNVSSPSAAVSVTTAAGPASGYVYPLKLSANSRYLTDQNNKPFFLVGDTAWSLIAQPSLADADLYLESRRQKGFSAVLVNLIEHKFGSIPGVPPFTGRAFATPNEAYFSRADSVILDASQKGLAVFLDPIYLGYGCGSEGWCGELMQATDAELLGWGQYLGNRYSFDNIVWVIGGDADPSSVKAKVQLIVNGIKQFDTRHLMTAHNAPEQTAVAPWPGAAWLDVNNVYSYTSTLYSNALAAYAASPVKPFFLVESAYENERNATALDLRKQSYWTVLSGGFGHIYGNCPVWNFDSPAASTFCSVTNWKTQLDSPGTSNMAYLAKLFTSRNWYTLVPDTTHAVLTGGYGTAGSTDYAVAASAADGSTIIAYLPTARKVTINATGLSGAMASAWWYDPATGISTTIGTLAKSSSISFTPPASSGGDQLLVLDSADSIPGGTDSSSSPDTQPPTTPLGVTATASSSTQIALAWLASADNVGVAGYRISRNGIQVATVTTGTIYVDSGLVAGSTNQYSVVAFDSAGNASTPSVTVSATTPATVTPNLVAGYSFNEGTGSSAGDASGNGNTGILTGTPTWTTQGKNLGALAFNGSTSYVNLGNPSVMQITGSITLSAWVKASAFPVDDAAIISKRAAGDQGYQLDTTVDTGPRTAGFKLSSSAGTDMSRYGRTALQANQWYHIAGVYDAAARTLNVYLNGVLDNGTLSGTVSSAQQNSTMNVFIGKRPGRAGFEWNGAIDDVRVYNRALTPADIQADMNSGVTPR